MNFYIRDNLEAAHTYVYPEGHVTITNTNIEKYTSVGLRLANGSTIYADNLKFNGSIESAETKAIRVDCKAKYFSEFFVKGDTNLFESECNFGR